MKSARRSTLVEVKDWKSRRAELREARSGRRKEIVSARSARAVGSLYRPSTASVTLILITLLPSPFPLRHPRVKATLTS